MGIGASKVVHLRAHAMGYKKGPRTLFPDRPPFLSSGPSKSAPERNGQEFSGLGFGADILQEHIRKRWKRGVKG